MLDDISVGDTDRFQFDFTRLFPAGGIDGALLVFASEPAGWEFTGQVVVDSRVSVYGTPPDVPGYYTIFCTATDDTARVLTIQDEIAVIPRPLP
jgi:hypothetical protein